MFTYNEWGMVYKLNYDGETFSVSITGDDKIMTISNTYENSPVIRLAESKNSLDNLEQINLPDTLKVICSYAFKDAIKLNEIIIPESVECIESNAFINCHSLTTVFIPKCVKSIKSTSFNNCRNLKEIIVDENNDYYTSIDGCLFTKDKKELIFYPEAKNDSTYMIPLSVEKVHTKAFVNSKFINLLIPGNIKKLESNMVENCNELINLTLGDGIMEICSSAFFNCSSIRLVFIPKTVSNFHPNAFLDCTKIYKYEVAEDSNYYKTDNKIIYTKDMSTVIRCPYYFKTHYVMPDSVVNVGDFAYSNVFGMYGFKMGKNVKRIGSYAFSNGHFTHITLPDNVEYIGDFAFSYNTIHSFEFPDCKIEFGENVFANCKFVNYNAYEKGKYLGSKNNPYFYLVGYNIETRKKARLHSDLKYIGSDAITDMEFREIVLPSGVVGICSNAINGLTDLTKITIPNSVEYIHTPFCSISNIEIEVELDSTNTNFKIENNCLIDIRNKELIKHIGSTRVLELRIPDYIEVVGKSALDTLTDGAERIYIPKSIKKFKHHYRIGKYIFDILYYEGTLSNWCNIEFENPHANLMSSSKHVYIKNEDGNYSSIKTLVFDESIKQIGSYQFYGANEIVFVEIKSDKISISKDAFLEANVQSITNNSNLNLEFGSLENGAIAYVAKRIIDKFGCKYIYDKKKILHEDCLFIKTDYGVNLVAYFGNKDDLMLPEPRKNKFIIKELKGVNKVRVPSGYHVIAKKAFENSPYLELIVIMDTVQIIEEDAFKNCFNLSIVALPSTLRKVFSNVFYGDYNLYVEFRGIIDDWMKIDFVNEYSNPMYCSKSFIIKDEFNEYNSLENLVIPASFDSIGKYQFAGLNSLLSVDTKGCIDNIGESSFRNCKNLRSINVNKDYPTVNDNAFYCCTSLKKVSFYTNTCLVAKNAFDGCNKDFE